MNHIKLKGVVQFLAFFSLLNVMIFGIYIAVILFTNRSKLKYYMRNLYAGSEQKPLFTINNPLNDINNILPIFIIFLIVGIASGQGLQFIENLTRGTSVGELYDSMNSLVQNFAGEKKCSNFKDVKNCPYFRLRQNGFCVAGNSNKCEYVGKTTWNFVRSGGEAILSLPSFELSHAQNNIFEKNLEIFDERKSRNKFLINKVYLKTYMITYDNLLIEEKSNKHYQFGHTLYENDDRKTILLTEGLRQIGSGSQRLGAFYQLIDFYNRGQKYGKSTEAFKKRDSSRTEGYYDTFSIDFDSNAHSLIIWVRVDNAYYLICVLDPHEQLDLKFVDDYVYDEEIE